MPCMDWPALAWPRFIHPHPEVLWDHELSRRIVDTADRLHSLLEDGSISEIETDIKRSDVIGSINRPVEFAIDHVRIADILRVNRPAVEGAEAKLIIEPSEFVRSVHNVLKIRVNHDESYVEATLIGDYRAPFVSRQNISRSDYNLGGDGSGTSLKSSVHHFVAWLIFQIFDSAAAFPAERKAIQSMHLASIMNWYQSSAQVSASYASSTSDYLLMMLSLENLAKNGVEDGDFKGLAELLEGKLLQGRTEFSKEKRGNERSIEYLFGNNRELAIHAASSMVRSLVGLDLYLKMIAKRGSIIVIDEPEMNAHPEAQLKIIEFLAILANSGIRVVFTTHSPYIVDHLSNLMMASRVAEGSRQTVADRFKLGRPEAFIAPENVSAYLFRENGNVENVLDRREASIDLGTFGEQTEFMVNLIHTILNATPDESQPIEEIRHAV